jgi:hypothetical protein
MGGWCVDKFGIDVNDTDAVAALVAKSGLTVKPLETSLPIDAISIKANDNKTYSPEPRSNPLSSNQIAEKGRTINPPMLKKKSSFTPSFKKNLEMFQRNIDDPTTTIKRKFHAPVSSLLKQDLDPTSCDTRVLLTNGFNRRDIFVPGKRHRIMPLGRSASSPTKRD